MTIASKQSPAVAHDRAGVAETAPEPATLIAHARVLIARYLAEPAATIDTMIFWCLHAWAHARFEVSPRLILHGRDRRADHARALRVLAWLTPSPRVIVRTTSLHVLDLIARERCTLLFDDAAHAILARRDMRALIAAGARAEAAFLVRRSKAGATFRDCAAPLAISTAEPPPPDVLGHAIVVPMAPALVDDGQARPSIGAPPAEALALSAAFERFAERLANQALDTGQFPLFLSATARETWAPLFALARAVGGEAPATIRAAASQFATAEHLEPPTSPLALLRDVRRVVGVDNQPVSSLFLIEMLTRDADSPWVACDWGNKLTARGLAQRLARFALKPQVIFPPHAAAFRGYKAQALLGAFARYLDDPVAAAFLRSEPRNANA
jgi:hypothetical protein